MSKISPSHNVYHIDLMYRYFLLLSSPLDHLEGFHHAFKRPSSSMFGVRVQVGLCAKLSESEVSEPAKALIARLHKLAKAERPLWVR